jgi:hypothetical protein
MNRSMVIRMISESAIIVVSILVALSADAWLDTRRQDAQREGHLAALTRDFSQMSERVDASYDAANRAVQSGTLLLRKLQENADLDPELVPEWLWVRPGQSVRIVFMRLRTAGILASMQ